MRKESASVRPGDLKVLILALSGQDGPLIQRALTAARISCLICRSLGEVTERIVDGAGAVLLAQEALEAQALEAFVRVLQAQPSWSDPPITLLTLPGAGRRAFRHIPQPFDKVGNLTVLERPLHASTLVSVVGVALRSRARQYELRDLVERLTTSQIQLQEKISDLEQFQDVVVGRELKMIELEKRLEELQGGHTG